MFLTADEEETPRPRNVFFKHKLEGKGFGVGRFVAVSPKGDLVAAPGRLDRDYIIRVWDARTREIVKDLPFDDENMSVGFTPDGSRLVVPGGKNPVSFWNVKTWEKELELEGTQPGVARVFFGKGKDEYILYSRQTVAWWDLKTRMPCQEYQADFRPSYCFDLSPDQKWLAFGSFTGEVQMFDDRRENARRWQVAEGRIHSLKFSPDGKRLAAAGKFDNSNTVFVCDARKGEVLGQLNLPRLHPWTDIHQLEFDRITGLLAVAGAGNRGAVPLFDINARRQVFNLIVVPATFQCVAFFPDGRQVVAGALDGQYVIWELPAKAKE